MMARIRQATAENAIERSGDDLALMYICCVDGECIESVADISMLPGGAVFLADYSAYLLPASA